MGCLRVVILLNKVPLSKEVTLLRVDILPLNNPDTLLKVVPILLLHTEVMVPDTERIPPVLLAARVILPNLLMVARVVILLNKVVMVAALMVPVILPNPVMLSKEATELLSLAVILLNKAAILLTPTANTSRPIHIDFMC